MNTINQTDFLEREAKTKAATADLVSYLPGYGSLSNTQFAGYASVRGQTGNNGAETCDEKLFYWFVGSADYHLKPTIIWTNGGPGSSSFWGFFLENGPYRIDATGSTLTEREHAWNKHNVNYMIFEHPLSVTLSVQQSDTDVPKNVEQGIAQLYQALLNFIQLHPEIAKNPIILAGESYAGTYLPLLAKAILIGNAQGMPPINLQLMVLCDAWVDPMVQMATDTTWALNHGLISTSQKRWLDETYSNRLPEINNAIQKLCGCYMTNIAQTADPSFQPIYNYLNRDDVREALHIPNGLPSLTQNWSALIGQNYTAQVNNSYRHIVQELLDGQTQDASANPLHLINGDKLKIRVVSGLNDAKDCNFLGTDAWLSLLEGYAAFTFHQSPCLQWCNKHKQVLGFTQGNGQLGWLKVLNAGHMAAMDQPDLIFYILDALHSPTDVM